MLCASGALSRCDVKECALHALVKGVLILMTRWDMSAQHFERAAISFIISNILAPFVSYICERARLSGEKRGGRVIRMLKSLLCVCFVQSQEWNEVEFLCEWVCVCTRSGAELKEPAPGWCLVLRCNFWKTTSFWNMKGDVCAVLFSLSTQAVPRQSFINFPTTFVRISAHLHVLHVCLRTIQIKMHNNIPGPK